MNKKQRSIQRRIDLCKALSRLFQRLLPQRFRHQAVLARLLAAVQQGVGKAAVLHEASLDKRKIGGD